MSRRCHCVAGLFLLAGAAASGGCTLVKPVVGAVTGPAVVLAASGGHLGCCCNDWRAAVIVLAVASGIGACGGLVTGIISDVQWLCGNAEDPTRNWHHPFAINTQEPMGR
jgi:hypothetical protein